MKKITCKVEQEDCLALERTDYEIRILKELIAFFVNICDNESKKEMLDVYISDYKKQLEQDFLHYEMLKEKISQEHLPDGFKLSQNVNYCINWDKGEIVYDVN